MSEPVESDVGGHGVPGPGTSADLVEVDDAGDVALLVALRRREHDLTLAGGAGARSASAIRTDPSLQNVRFSCCR